MCVCVSVCVCVCVCVCPQPGSVTLTKSLESRLSTQQKQLLALNRALIYVLSNRLDAAKQVAAQLSKMEPVKQAPHLLPLLQAAVLQKENKVSVITHSRRYTQAQMYAHTHIHTTHLIQARNCVCVNVSTCVCVCVCVNTVE